MQSYSDPQISLFNKENKPLFNQPNKPERHWSLDTSAPMESERRSQFPPAFPPALQVAIKGRIRELWATCSKYVIAKKLVSEFKIGQSTAFSYINKVMREDVRGYNRENLIGQSAHIADFNIIKLGRILAEVERMERDTSHSEEPYFNPGLKVMIVRQLGEENERKVKLAQELSQIEKPTQKVSMEGEIWLGNVVRKIEERMKTIDVKGEVKKK